MENSFTVEFIFYCKGVSVYNSLRYAQMISPLSCDYPGRENLAI